MEYETRVSARACHIMATANPLAGTSDDSPQAMTKKVLREQRRLKAEHYRQLYLLPRYVQEEGGKRKLEAGEFDPKSELYPLSTPIDQLSDFGEFLSPQIIRLCLCKSLKPMLIRSSRPKTLFSRTFFHIFQDSTVACHF